MLNRGVQSLLQTVFNQHPLKYFFHPSTYIPTEVAHGDPCDAFCLINHSEHGCYTYSGRYMHHNTQRFGGFCEPQFPHACDRHSTYSYPAAEDLLHQPGFES